MPSQVSQAAHVRGSNTPVSQPRVTPKYRNENRSFHAVLGRAVPLDSSVGRLMDRPQGSSSDAARKNPLSPAASDGSAADLKGLQVAQEPALACSEQWLVLDPMLR